MQAAPIIHKINWIEYFKIVFLSIKTSGSELRGQEEAACTRFQAYAIATVSYLHGWSV